MSAIVRIPTALRSKAGGSARLSISGGNVQEALQQLKKACPALIPMLWSDDGSLRPQVSIYVNDVHIRYLDGVETPLAEGDEMFVMPMVMGG